MNLFRVDTTSVEVCRLLESLCRKNELIAYNSLPELKNPTSFTVNKDRNWYGWATQANNSFGSSLTNKIIPLEKAIKLLTVKEEKTYHVCYTKTEITTNSETIKAISLAQAESLFRKKLQKRFPSAQIVIDSFSPEN